MLWVSSHAIKHFRQRRRLPHLKPPTQSHLWSMDLPNVLVRPLASPRKCQLDLPPPSKMLSLTLTQVILWSHSLGDKCGANAMYDCAVRRVDVDKVICVLRIITAFSSCTYVAIQYTYGICTYSFNSLNNKHTSTKSAATSSWHAAIAQYDFHFRRQEKLSWLQKIYARNVRKGRGKSKIMSCPCLILT